MDERQEERLTGRELNALFDRLFPHEFVGADVLAEIAPEGWEHSPLLARFRASVAQLFEERLAMHRNLEQFRCLGGRRAGAAPLGPRSEPTLEDLRRDYGPSPVNQKEEVTELVGLCLWNVFSDNHGVIAAERRRRHRIIPRRRCVPGRVSHARPGGLERATTCGSTWERSGFPGTRRRHGQSRRQVIRCRRQRRRARTHRNVALEVERLRAELREAKAYRGAMGRWTTCDRALVPAGVRA